MAGERAEDYTRDLFIYLFSVGLPKIGMPQKPASLKDRKCLSLEFAMKYLKTRNKLKIFQIKGQLKQPPCVG